MPAPLETLIQPDHGAEGVQRVCGYGLIDEDYLLHFGDRRVTLVTRSSIRIDSFLVFEVPVPAEFRRAEGDKRMIVSLAYDPPVRRRRAEYLGVELYFSLIRGKTRDEVIEAYRAVTSDERNAAKPPSGETAGSVSGTVQVPLKPGPTALATSTLQRAEWTFESEGTDYGDPWYLVVRRGPELGSGLDHRTGLRTRRSPWKLPRSRLPTSSETGCGHVSNNATGTGLIGFISTGCGHGISGRSAVN